MKKAVDFFYVFKENISKIAHSLKVSTIIISYAIIVILAIINFLKTPNGIKQILNFGTNIMAEKSKNKYSISDLICVYPVFNGDNYIVANSKNAQEVDKAENEENKLDTSTFDASAVDAISNKVVTSSSNYVRKSTKNYDRIDIYGITIYDYSSKNIDYEELFKRNVNLTKKSDPVLLYCSHTSESYSNSENFKFDYSGNYRSKDASYNMLSVASIISSTLKDRGLTTVFDTTPHDYTSYDNAYKNSMKTINNNIQKNSRFGLTIDVHRDAAADLSFGPTVKINGKDTAKLMLVIGVGYYGFPNEYWEANLALALQIARLGEEMYPGLFRHVLVRDARYNQHLNEGSILVEVGATGNTLEEAYYGARCFSNIISRIYK